MGKNKLTIDFKGFDEYMEKVLTQKQAEEVMTRLLL